MKTSTLYIAIVSLSCVAFNTSARAEVIPLESGPRVKSVNIQQDNDAYTVFGKVDRGTPAHRVIGSHIHILLLDKNGKIIQSDSVGLAPSSPRRDVASSHRVDYSFTIPAKEIAKTSLIKVEYLSRSHTACQAGSECPAC